MGFYDREVNFYRSLAGAIDVRTPRCYHADIAPTAPRSCSCSRRSPARA
jgi:hypothetical protein